MNTKKRKRDRDDASILLSVHHGSVDQTYVDARFYAVEVEPKYSSRCIANDKRFSGFPIQDALNVGYFFFVFLNLTVVV